LLVIFPNSCLYFLTVLNSFLTLVYICSLSCYHWCLWFIIAHPLEIILVSCLYLLTFL
jgi:hypothetical protein